MHLHVITASAPWLVGASSAWEITCVSIVKDTIDAQARDRKNERSTKRSHNQLSICRLRLCLPGFNTPLLYIENRQLGNFKI